jgi:beta-xylosidase
MARAVTPTTQAAGRRERLDFDAWPVVGATSGGQAAPGAPPRTRYAPRMPSGARGRPWGAQGDGRYENPILPADYSDPDAIRVGQDYYLISSTFQLAPGMVVLHSLDLVNWSTIGYAVPDLRIIGPELNWDRMARYNYGIYAGAIRYHAGLFWVYFTSYWGEGFFVSTARDPRGPWEVSQLLDGKGRPLRVMKWDDPCPFWDDDGKAYLAASKVAGAWYPHLFQMSLDGTRLLDADVEAMNREGPQPSGEGTVIYRCDTSEASKIYKINDYYYLFHNEVVDGTRVGMMKRARHLFGTHADGSRGEPGNPGTYEVRQIMRGRAPEDREPNQGALVQAESGLWYFLTHEGKGGYPDGRPVSLLPVTWVDDWPIPGLGADRDGVGGVLAGSAVPVVGHEATTPQGSDDFDGPLLSPQWQWNHQPRDDFWSLTDRPGHLRLRAFRPLVPGDFFKAGNTLSQRTFGAEWVVITTKMDIQGMSQGQCAGLVHFNGGLDHARLSVVCRGETRAIVYQSAVPADRGIDLPNSQRAVWLRSRIDRDAKTTFEFSLDGHAFTPHGAVYELTWGNYRGDQVGLYTYNDREDRGYVDIDWFRYSVASGHRASLPRA